MDYARNRQVKYDRVYKTIGKMTPLRVLLGALLLLSVFFLAGTVSESFANRGMFRAAELCMLSPTWMEKYKPEEKAYIEAGVLYESGDYDAAMTAFSQIENLPPADMMVSACRIKTAQRLFASGDAARAYEYFSQVNTEGFSKKLLEEYRSAAAALYDYYSASGGSDELLLYLSSCMNA